MTTFPKTEIYGLASKMQRNAVSVPSNIAERSKRQTKADFRQLLSIALGSLAELETQYEIARRLGLVKKSAGDKIEPCLVKVSEMLTVLTIRTKDL